MVLVSPYAKIIVLVGSLFFFMPTTWALDGPAISLEHSPTIQWIIKLKKRSGIGRGLFQFVTPLIVGDRLYVGTAGGQMYGIDRAHGVTVWNIPTAGPVTGPARAFGEHLYFGDGKGIVYAVQTVDGSSLWQSAVGSEIMAAPVVTDMMVYVVTMQAELVALDRATGAQKWRTPRRLISAQFTVKGASSPIFTDGRVVVGSPDGIVAAHDAATGALVWEQRLAAPTAILQDVDTTPVRVGNLLVAGAVEGILAGIDARSGRIVWKREIGTPNEIGTDHGIAYVAGAGRLSELDVASGTVRWKVRLPVDETSGPIIVGDKLVLLTPTDQLYVLRRDDGAIIGKRHLITGTYGHPATDGEQVYVVTNGGNLIALKIP